MAFEEIIAGALRPFNTGIDVNGADYGPAKKTGKRRFSLTPLIIVDMHFRLTLSRKALLLVAFPLVFELAFIFILVAMLQQLEVERQREAHARDVTNHLNKTLRYLLESGSDGVLINLTGSQVFKDRYTKTWHLLHDETAWLSETVGHEPGEAATVGSITRLLDDCNLCLDVLYKQSLSGTRDNAMPALLRVQKLMETIFATGDGVIEREQAVERAEAQALVQARYNISVFLLAGVVLNIIMAVMLTLYFNAGTTRRLKHLMNNVVKFGSQHELELPQKGTDEIAHLDQVFYDMAIALSNARRKENAIIENAVDVICSVQSDGRITAINPAVRKSWGYSQEELVGSRLSLILLPEEVEETLGALHRAVDGQSPVTFENRIRRKDGSFVDLLWSASWSPTEHSLFCIAHNITERKEIERLKQDFVAMISHDLRTPLTSVQGFLSLLSAGAYNELSQAGKESLAFAETSITRLIQLVNDLLDLEKMEAGRLELRRAPVWLPGLVEDAVNSMQSFAEQQGVVLQCHAPQSCSDVFADPARLLQVIVNLLSNAIKFSPQGSMVTVHIFEKGAFVEVAVEDEGRGVPAELRESIFEKFKQVEPGDERLKGGSGLGLAICKAIIEQHGGSIGVRARQERTGARASGAGRFPGSCFWFQLSKTSGSGKVVEELGSTVS
jgi:PAS domain S-box-containing protein